MLGVKLKYTADKVLQACLYTTFNSGGNLSNYLREFGFQLTKDKLQSMTRDILQMLEQLRSSNILHRDFKAKNIAVSERGRLFLIDFGSAVEHKHRMALTGKCLTTTTVRAPEIICATRNYSFAVDTWAAGCVL